MISVYTATKTELMKQYNLSQYRSKYNNIVKLISKAESLGDDILVASLSALLPNIDEAYRYYSKRMPSNVEYVCRNIDIRQRDIIVYCDSMKGEPEWMILAKRAGWRPPE